MDTLSYVTLDVFTSTRFEGNPLAVISDARGLSDAAMQRIATEFNYSEVTFVLPPEDPENSARVRIFTPTMEIPFAGHPNVGTAYVLGQQAEIFGKPVGEKLRFEEEAGIVEVSLKRSGGKVAATAIRAPQPLAIGDAIAEETIARCIGLEPGAVVKTSHVPVFASVGLNFAIAELSGLEALAAARPNLAGFQAAAGRQTTSGHDFSLFLYVRTPEDPWEVRARMFAPLDNVPEDPATGSASAALGAYLVSLAPDSDMDVRITIEQGVEMGRRSIIALDVAKSGGIVTDVVISGSCVSVMRGEIILQA
ncbi:phenazine antibiotic biosynthesis-like protein [Rhizobium leguminosarum bv. trifolii CB782]|uniref:PhzF family phenazine biosynthesis protein n=1 Tax=Rhizobium hidalgonense TaxID=1538159 RepID=A0ABX4JXB1_9HYPH|nr:PhzF family phenazine biosynthesis protein [Rhizobium hidalgonense]AHG46794.1 phenazine antibiotic biosynthesis-like protein [Rhizobium leguminosarum bv. trifolii CB782]EJC77744.1 phenazine biosynthesis protein PhzF family [Rhizobium leguminosarum bv. trifolii WSM2012]MDR9805888.1 PhzF family phenazine biosynthesis protein [Rhizobium hidalgonense]MDR9811793.1 PhzF family phenazine biosynthesis protein [Rhizobium hidalgonense]PDT24741.1 PhzF family phenazine biosynthesis protein [Rhizobium h